MNPPCDDNENEERLIQLDRLAAGDLALAARRELFDWLDADPNRWRRCALVLLEARELAQVFGEWKSETPQREFNTALVVATPKRRKTHWPLLAAGILTAFGLGLGINHIRVPFEQRLAQDPNEHDGRKTEHADHTSDDSAPPNVVDRSELQPADQQRQQPIIGAENSQLANNDVIPEYVRSQLERRGYRVNSQPSVVSVAFPNGENVEVPVNRVQFSYVGQQSY